MCVKILHTQADPRLISPPVHVGIGSEQCRFGTYMCIYMRQLTEGVSDPVLNLRKLLRSHHWIPLSDEILSRSLLEGSRPLVSSSIFFHWYNLPPPLQVFRSKSLLFPFRFMPMSRVAPLLMLVIRRMKRPISVRVGNKKLLFGLFCLRHMHAKSLQVNV